MVFTSASFCSEENEETLRRQGHHTTVKVNTRYFRFIWHWWGHNQVDFQKIQSILRRCSSVNQLIVSLRSWKPKEWLTNFVQDGQKILFYEADVELVCTQLLQAAISLTHGTTKPKQLQGESYPLWGTFSFATWANRINIKSDSCFDVGVF